MIYTTQEELDAGLAKWQKILRLQDWDVRVSIARTRDFEIEDAAAEIRFYWARKMATIKLRDPLDWEDSYPMLQDHEYDIVHELVHLHIDNMNHNAGEDCEDRRNEKEQCINLITWALVDMSRQIPASSLALGELPVHLPTNGQHFNKPSEYAIDQRTAS